ncbi:hypothetical protein D3C73_1606830 [compost metagenome]
MKRQAIEIVGDGVDGRGHDGLVQRGQEHAEHESHHDGEGLTMGQDLAGGPNGRGFGHIFSRGGRKVD